LSSRVGYGRMNCSMVGIAARRLVLGALAVFLFV
jgi:hypothetical protein